MVIVEEMRDKRVNELVEGFFRGAGCWIREHGRIHTAVILRSDIAGLETEFEAYRLAAESLQERGYRARYNKRVELDDGDSRFYKIGIYIEF